MGIKATQLEIVADAIEQGLPIKDAAALAGIGRASYYRLLEENEKFKAAIEGAEARFKQKALAKIAQAAKLNNSKAGGNWQAAAWLLERRFKDDFSLRSELTGKDGKDLRPVTEVEIIHATKEDLKKAETNN